MHNKLLQTRLKNCLQTIIDLEPRLLKMTLGREMLQDFRTLKAFIKEVDSLSLSEEEVSRVENSTNIFLAELILPFMKENEEDGRILTILQ